VILPAERLELLIYKHVNALHPPVNVTLNQLSQVTGEKDYGRIVERLKDLDASQRIQLTKYKGGSRLSRSEFGNDGGFFWTEPFLIEVAPQGRKHFEELEQRAELQEEPLPTRKPPTSDTRLMPPRKAIEILKPMVNNSAFLSGEPFGFPKREQWTRTAEGALARSFAPGSPILVSFGTAQSIVFTAGDSDEKLRRVANENLASQVAVLKSAIEQLGWELGEEEPVTPGEYTAIDDLLPVLRRKVFDQDLEAFGSSAREGEPVSLLMLDLDHFKVVNDTHGHPVGDEVLIECANIVARRCRNKGKVYRFGGEEIAVLLPNFTVVEAVALAESIRSEIEKGRVSSKKLAITASIGVATTPTHTTEGKQLFKIADQALYAAKHLGRNLVRVAGEDPEIPTSDVLRRAEPAEVGQPVEMTLSYQRLVYTGEHHNYRLTVTLKNISTAVIENYHVDVIFPTGLLHKDVIYALELPNRRTATHSLFRTSTETRQVNTLYPGDPAVTMTIDYYVDREIFHYHHEWLQENVTAILYIKGSPPLTVQRPISEMQEF
jgi:diguanylate cyclase (GGDEF)-like protein